MQSFVISLDSKSNDTKLGKEQLDKAEISFNFIPIQI